MINDIIIDTLLPKRFCSSFQETIKEGFDKDNYIICLSRAKNWSDEFLRLTQPAPSFLAQITILSPVPEGKSKIRIHKDLETYDPVYKGNYDPEKEYNEYVIGIFEYDEDKMDISEEDWERVNRSIEEFLK